MAALNIRQQEVDHFTHLGSPLTTSLARHPPDAHILVRAAGLDGSVLRFLLSPPQVLRCCLLGPHSHQSCIFPPAACDCTINLYGHISSCPDSL